MTHILEFLSALRLNNNREWFEAHRSWYLQTKTEFETFVTDLIDGIAGFDPTIRGLTVKNCTYRIYRDTRFSHDKSPYKTHMGAYICRGGKNSGYSGYYFHIEPRNSEGFVGCSLLSTGIYMPEPKVVRSIREEIDDHGPDFLSALKRASGFHLNQENKLRRVPVGFSAENAMAEYLKLKDFYLEKELDDTFLSAPDLLQKTVTAFKKTKSFNDLINRAVQYAYEEM